MKKNKIYKLDIENFSYWHKEYNFEKHIYYFHKVTSHIQLYIEKVPSFIYNGMICNYRCGNKGIRIREEKDNLVLEPNGIIIPYNKLYLVTHQGTDDSNTIENITINTFICNYIATHTKDVTNTISLDEYHKIEKIIKEEEVSESFFQIKRFLSLFCYIKLIENKPTFNKENLLDCLKNNRNKPTLFPLLAKLNLDPDNLDLAILYFKYVGILYSNIDNDNDLTISKNIAYLNQMLGENEKYLSQMIDFAKIYHQDYEKNPIHLLKIKKIKH